MRAEEEREFGEFVTARRDRLRRFAYLLCGDWHTADDAVQAATLRLYLSWRRIRHKDSVEAYARRILLSAIADQRRTGWRRREQPAADPPEHAGDGGTTGVEERLRLLAALARLAPRQRAAVVLRYWEDMSIEQTAVVLGCSPGTVKSQAARGLETLRELLGSAVPESTPSRGRSRAEHT